jgi:hypothetical protein
VIMSLGGYKSASIPVPLLVVLPSVAERAVRFSTGLAARLPAYMSSVTHNAARTDR